MCYISEHVVELHCIIAQFQLAKPIFTYDTNIANVSILPQLQSCSLLPPRPHHGTVPMLSHSTNSDHFSLSRTADVHRQSKVKSFLGWKFFSFDGCHGIGRCAKISLSCILHIYFQFQKFMTFITKTLFKTFFIIKIVKLNWMYEHKYYLIK